MTLNQKTIKINFLSPVLINLCIYLFLSSVVYYLFSLNLALVKLLIVISAFSLVFYLSSTKSRNIIKKLKVKNVIVISKFLLGVITLSSAILIYNQCSLNSITFYFLILSAAVLNGILNKAYSRYNKVINTKNSYRKIKNMLFHFNVERILIIILASISLALIEINIIPLVLASAAIYYFISAYVNTFQEF